VVVYAYTRSHDKVGDEVLYLVDLTMDSVVDLIIDSVVDLTMDSVVDLIMD
jgi:hypothetical protein